MGAPEGAAAIGEPVAVEVTSVAKAFLKLA